MSDKHAPRFASGGQSTQLIVGATPDSDYQIMSLSAALYKKIRAQARVLFGVYPGRREPASARKDNGTAASARAQELYQADWLFALLRLRCERTAR